MGQIGTRINIRGISGSGKSTFANSLGDITGMRVIHLDDLFWKPNWVESDRLEFKSQIAEVVTVPGWIVDGNYSSVEHAARSTADTVIWLDYPFLIVFWRIFSRSFARGWTRTEVFPGCRESLWTAFFSSKSVIWWSVSNWARSHRNAEKYFSNVPEGIHGVWLRHPKDAEQFLDSIRKQFEN